MKLAYSTNAFTRHTLEYAIQSIADIGFDGVEILCDKPHWFPGKTTRSETNAIVQLLEKNNLSVSNLNANTSNGYFHPLPIENVFEPALSNADKTLREWRIQYTINAIKLAKDIGADCISVTSGKPTPGCLPETAANFFVDSLKRICEKAGQYNIKIGIEYEPGLIIENGVEALDILQRVDSPLLGINYDIGHSYLVRENPAEIIQNFKNRIWNVHVEDIKAYKHFHLIPGEGELPFQDYFKALNDIHYKRFLTVELYSYPDNPVEAGKSSLAYLSKIIENNVNPHN